MHQIYENIDAPFKRHSIQSMSEPYLLLTLASAQYITHFWLHFVHHNLHLFSAGNRRQEAAEASAILLQRQGRDSLRKLEDKLGVQLKFIHVIRNPFDNIATMALRTADLKKNKPQDDLKVGIYCIN